MSDVLLVDEVIQDGDGVTSPSNDLQDIENNAIGRNLLHTFGRFLTKHRSELNQINTANFNNIIEQQFCATVNESDDDELFDVVKLEDTDFYKTVITLSSICLELTLLHNEGKKYIKFFVHMIELGDLEDIEQLKSVYEQIQLTHGHIQRCHVVVAQAFGQIASRIPAGRHKHSPALFGEFWGCVGRVLANMIVFDRVCEDANIKDALLQFSGVLGDARRRADAGPEALQTCRAMERQLADMCEIMRGRNFEGALSFEPGLLAALNGSGAALDLASYSGALLAGFEAASRSAFYKEEWLELVAFVASLQVVFREVCPRLERRLLEANRRLLPLRICDAFVFKAEEFIVEFLPHLRASIDAGGLEAARNVMAKKRLAESVAYSVSCADECYRIIRSFANNTRGEFSAFGKEQLVRIMDDLTAAFNVIVKIGDQAKWLVCSHQEHDVHLTGLHVNCVLFLLDLLKSMEFFFRKRWYILIYCVVMLERKYAHFGQSLVKKAYEETNMAEPEKLARFRSALKVLESNIARPATSKRVILMLNAISASGFGPECFGELFNVLQDIRFTGEFLQVLTQICNTEFMYWHQVYMLPVFFSRSLDPNMDFSRFYLILQAMAGESSDNLLENFENNFLVPLNRNIEVNLRMQSDNFGNHQDAFELNPPTFLSTMPFGRINQKYYSLRKQAEHYLNVTFYNLSAIQIHDCSVYTSMRSLISLEYGLQLVDDDLPLQTVEQGLDVLLIMRHINLFVSKYLYNMNSQIFVEVSSASKHLNTIDISHIANSIRTHGYGIMNTTVNFTYQFLINKFGHFSQFLYDELVCARLAKEALWIRENPEAQYSFERASALNTQIKNFGESNGVSYMDKFRTLIGQIGNALGFVRMIQSGGRRCLGEIAMFVSDLKHMDFLLALKEDAGVSAATMEAAFELHDAVKSTKINYEECTEYFQLLLNTFTPVFRHSDHKHLRNFYAMIPALTINHVDSIYTRKENLFKKNKEEAAFTDDGFAMGLAFIVELLGQEAVFKHLHWFEVLKEKLKADVGKVSSNMANGSQEESFMQTCHLTLKRHAAYQTEFELLFSNYRSALTFYKTGTL